MKNYKQKICGWAFAAASVLTLGSCSDFLVIEPKTTVSEDNFWNEKADIEQFMTGIYTKMQEQAFIERCIVWGELRSDNVEGRDNLEAEDINLYRVIQEDLRATNPYTSWDDFYTVINRCNVVIERAKEVQQKDPSFKEGDMNAAIAEARAIRALCYFYLVRTFGDVPFNTQPVQSEDDVTSLPATSGDEIVSYLISDLEECVLWARQNYTPVAGWDIRCNRITRTTIYALLTDLYLWAQQYQKAVDAADEVIKSKVQQNLEEIAKSGSGLFNSPRAMEYAEENVAKNVPFSMYDPTGTLKGIPLYCNGSLDTQSTDDFSNVFNTIFGEQNSYESIFELNFQPDNRHDNNHLQNMGVARLYGNYFKEDYNGVKHSDGISLYIRANSQIAGAIKDKSKPQDVFTSYLDSRFYTGINLDGGATTTTGYNTKYVWAWVRSIYLGSERLSVADYDKYDDYVPQNWIFYRLTDIMLLQAEALVELGGEEMTTKETYEENGVAKKRDVVDANLARAFYLVWAVNRRSLMENYDKQATDELAYDKKMTQKELRNLVQEERKRELMFEGKRWFDLLRRYRRDGNPNYLQSQLSFKSNVASVFVNPAAFYWPYNRREVINNTQLSQKPYYDNEEDKGYESTNKL